MRKQGEKKHLYLFSEKYNISVTFEIKGTNQFLMRIISNS